MKLLCKLLGHRRSRRDARRIDRQWISYCRRCGSLMLREAPERWSVVTFVNGVPDQPCREARPG
jgi:hypothetical protein